MQKIPKRTLSVPTNIEVNRFQSGNMTIKRVDYSIGYCASVGRYSPVSQRRSPTIGAQCDPASVSGGPHWT